MQIMRQQLVKYTLQLVFYNSFAAFCSVYYIKHWIIQYIYYFLQNYNQYFRQQNSFHIFNWALETWNILEP